MKPLAIEDTLNEDLGEVAAFLRKWRLQPSVPKTLSCVFHLHNASASQGISVQLNGQLAWVGFMSDET